MTVPFMECGRIDHQSLRIVPNTNLTRFGNELERYVKHMSGMDFTFKETILERSSFVPLQVTHLNPILELLVIIAKKLP